MFHLILLLCHVLVQSRAIHLDNARVLGEIEGNLYKSGRNLRNIRTMLPSMYYKSYRLDFWG